MQDGPKRHVAATKETKDEPPAYSRSKRPRRPDRVATRHATHARTPSTSKLLPWSRRQPHGQPAPPTPASLDHSLWFQTLRSPLGPPPSTPTESDVLLMEKIKKTTDGVPKSILKFAWFLTLVLEIILVAVMMTLLVFGNGMVSLILGNAISRSAGFSHYSTVIQCVKRGCVGTWLVTTCGFAVWCISVCFSGFGLFDPLRITLPGTPFLWIPLVFTHSIAGAALGSIIFEKPIPLDSSDAVRAAAIGAAMIAPIFVLLGPVLLVIVDTAYGATRYAGFEESLEVKNRWAYGLISLQYPKLGKETTPTAARV